MANRLVCGVLAFAAAVRGFASTWDACTYPEKIVFSTLPSWTGWSVCDPNTASTDVWEGTCAGISIDMMRMACDASGLKCTYVVTPVHRRSSSRARARTRARTHARCFPCARA